MSAHDELARQLRESVRARRRRRRVHRGALLVSIGAVVIGGGVATAATGVLPVVHHDDHPLNAREVAHRAMREASDAPACRARPESDGLKTSPIAPAPAARRLLIGPPSAAAQRWALRVNHGGPIVAGSARGVDFAGRGSVALWLADGNGSGTLIDPAACGRARLEQLARDRPDPQSRLRQKAAAVLATYRDTRPGLQTLWVLYHRSGARSTGGAGIPLDGRPLPVGVVGYSSGTYVGIAVPGAVRVTLDGRTLHRAVAVRGGVFLVVLPRRGTGPVRLRQRAADGRVLAAQTLRR